MDWLELLCGDATNRTAGEDENKEQNRADEAGGGEVAGWGAVEGVRGNNARADPVGYDRLDGRGYA